MSTAFTMTPAEVKDAVFETISARATELGVPLGAEKGAALKTFMQDASVDHPSSQEEFDAQLAKAKEMTKEELEGTLSMVAMMNSMSP